MSPEQELARFVSTIQLADIPSEITSVAKQVLLTVCGTAMAGSTQDGISALRDVLTRQGGRPEATSFVYGDALPASSAALLNGTMARALDYCDAMKPGLHLGSSLVPAGLAAAQLNGGCSGADFMAALVAGMETGSRLNLTEATYDGFDPTGIAGVMGATATAARVAGLTEDQTLHALGLAFNRCAGSFQSNIDGSLAVRLIQGWVAEAAVQCVQLAQAGLTGPVNFLGGIYGYAHLYGRGLQDAAAFSSGIGGDYRLVATVFKKYPSCGLTQSVTELARQAVASGGPAPDQIARIEVRLPPYAYRLVGHPFQLGNTPRVDAQFSAQYCVANVFARGTSLLKHFEPGMISDPSVAALMERVHVYSDERLDEHDHTAARLTIHTNKGEEQSTTIDIAPGFPGNPLTERQHLQRFQDCLDYAEWPIPQEQAAALRASVENMELESDARCLLQQLVSKAAQTAVA